MRIASTEARGHHVASFRRKYSSELLLLAFTLIGNLTKPLVHISMLQTKGIPTYSGGIIQEQII